MDYLRDVVEEPRFMQDLDSYRDLYPRIDEVHASISWELSHHPALGTPLSVAPDYRVFETNAVGDTPAFWVLYWFDTKKIYLCSIEPVRKDTDEFDGDEF